MPRVGWCGAESTDVPKSDVECTAPQQLEPAVEEMEMGVDQPGDDVCSAEVKMLSRRRAGCGGLGEGPDRRELAVLDAERILSSGMAVTGVGEGDGAV